MGQYELIAEQIVNLEDLKKMQKAISEKVFNETVKEDFEEIHKVTEKFAAPRGYKLQYEQNILRFVDERGYMNHCLLIDENEVKLLQNCIPMSQVVKSYKISKYAKKGEVKEIVEQGLEAFVKYTIKNKCLTTMGID